MADETLRPKVSDLLPGGERGGDMPLEVKLLRIRNLLTDGHLAGKLKADLLAAQAERTSNVEAERSRFGTVFAYMSFSSFYPLFINVVLA